MFEFEDPAQQFPSVHVMVEWLIQQGVEKEDAEILGAKITAAGEFEWYDAPECFRRRSAEPKQ